MFIYLKAGWISMNNLRVHFCYKLPIPICISVFVIYSHVRCAEVTGPFRVCLCRVKLPTIYEHMQMLGIAWSMIATKWFVCLFAEVLPIEVRWR